MSEVISEAAHVIPGGPLAGLIARYDGFCQIGVPPARHLGLPSPYLTLIVMLDEPIQMVRHVDRTLAPATFDMLIGGLHAQPVEIAHDGVQCGIQLSIDPLASRPLFGVPAGELADLDLQGDEVLGAAAPELCERVAAAGTWEDRCAVIDSVLLPRVLTASRSPQASARPPAPVIAAWRLLCASAGTISIASLARTVGWSERQLETQFGREIGMTPKRAARVIRFDRARRMIQLQARRPRGSSLELARVAADCGYHDQPHLIRDFRAFSSMAPTTWLAHEFGNVQVDLAAAP